MKLNVQTIIIVILAVSAIGGFLLFARSSGSGGNQVARVVIWGTEPQEIMSTLAEGVTTKTTSVSYVQKPAATFEQDLLEALAAGTGPDLFLVSQDNALKYQKFIYQIPYQTYARRTYQNTFIDEANLFLNTQGIIALPFFIDPLVMYYNRALLSSAFVTAPPQYWDELIAFAPRLTLTTDAGAIRQSAIAFGTSGNVMHAKEILATLMMQAGNPIVNRTAENRLQTVMTSPSATVSNPADSALRFYTSFSDSAMQNYTWNASLPNSRQAFANGDLALYIGYASELPTIRQLNANLNFDVTLIPQTRNSGVKATFGNITGVAISKGTKNANAALQVAAALTSKDAVALVSQQRGLPPVRRDLLTAQSTDETYVSVFYNSAIIAQGFADPDATRTRDIFKRMIDSVNSRISDSYQAVQRASSDLSALLTPLNQTQQ